ncbi:MAG: hypothetical protein GY803_31210 [Chloroflexi bacterium]|nr:hypothetical protein [Chloroflexota bacterium]
MSQRKTFILFGLIFSLLAWGSLMPMARAQTPRPTPTLDSGQPTNTPPPPPVNTPEPAQSNADNLRGSIQGMVYQDVNGDGKCVNTAVAGEEPIVGVDVEFVSSDKETVITLYTGEDGRYGLTAAGFSYWEVAAKPDSKWTVTSEKTLYVPIYEDSRSATDINFCLQSVKAGQTAQTGETATILLPAAGGQNTAQPLNWILLIGILLIATGLVINWQQRRET